MASRFAPQLGTNYCPKDDEVLEIKSFLVEPTLRLRRLNDIIADLQKAIDKLAEERDGLGAYVEAHKALISPVRRLPLDIIQEIFEACLPTHRNCVMSASEAPILLGRICSSWRAISLATPRLWARLHVVEPRSYSNPSFDQQVAQHLETTKMWLGRSGQCPLSISLQSAPEDGGGSPADTHAASIQFLQALIPFAPRWEHIDFTTPPSLLLEVMSYLDVDLPLLETVAFHHKSHRVLGEVSCGPFNMLRGARISSFSIPGSMFIPERFPLLWNQLTTLTIGGPSWPVVSGLTSEAMLRAIARCPRLMICKLMIFDPDTETAMLQHPTVELPFLHTLAVHCVAHVNPAVSVLFNHLFVPKLRDFTFLGSSQHMLQDSLTFSDFFTSAIRLESFDICTSIFTGSSFRETLCDLPPTIQRLKIRNSDGGWGQAPLLGLDDEAMAALTLPGVCPVLQHLSIDPSNNISDEAVLQFITTRRLECPSTLKHVEIRFDRQMTLDIMPSLQAFIETGLTVSLNYHPPLPPFHHSPWQGLPDAPPVPAWYPPPMTLSHW
ncbi:hypothetical protein B0H14DRAFT_1407873 [Mycena olivaceomarginata]|nr:hypothetical protein B0H14DRAFT_1407873 [Mycena olivaceomarginata]